MTDDSRLHEANVVADIAIGAGVAAAICAFLVPPIYRLLVLVFYCLFRPFVLLGRWLCRRRQTQQKAFYYAPGTYRRQ